MIFKVFEEQAMKEKPEPEVYLRLEEFYGEVAVVVCDKAGKIVTRGYVCHFKRNGTLFLNPGISHGLGFALDENDRIIISS